MAADAAVQPGGPPLARLVKLAAVALAVAILYFARDVLQPLALAALLAFLLAPAVRRLEHRGAPRPHELQDFEAVHVRHIKVEHDQRHRGKAELLDRFETAGSFDDGDGSLTERCPDHPSDGWRVVNDQDGLHSRRTT